MSLRKRNRSRSTESERSVRARGWKRNRSPLSVSRNGKQEDRRRLLGSRADNLSGSKHYRRQSSVRRSSPRRSTGSRLFTEDQHASAKSNESEDVGVRLDRLECLLHMFVSRNCDRHDERVIKYNVQSDCIPEFHPDRPDLSANKWLEKIEQLAAINGWDENAKIYVMQNRLAGLAKSWYNDLNSYNRPWDEWKRLVNKTFPEHHDFATSLRKLINRVKMPNETMTEYYFAKMALIRSCKISGKDAVSCLIDGLQNPTIQTTARAGRYSSPEDLYSEFLSSVNVLDKRCSQVEHLNESTNIRKYKHNEREQHDKKMKENGISKLLKCFNCNQKGHISTKCNKPRIECKNCNRLGHDIINCPRSKTSVKYVDLHAKENDCYYVDCKVNGKSVHGYIDTGCSGVLLKEKYAKELKLKVQPCALRINGYGGGSASVVGKVVVSLEVDLVKAEIETLVVPDEVQEIPLLVGKTFLNNEKVSFVVRDNKIRVFSKDVILPEIECLPPSKVAMWAKDAVVIPPNSISFVECSSDVSGDLYVEDSYRPVVNAEYWLCGGVVNSKAGHLAIANVSSSDVKVRSKEIVARGTLCEEDQRSPEVSTLKADIHKLDSFTVEEISNQTDEGIDADTKMRLLSLLNKYRRCFARNISELGKTHIHEMQINLNDSKPVVYRPYRMSACEREIVRSIVQELLENQIVRDSNSPFSSPILLVKKKTGEYRMCVDYRRLNAQTVKDVYPIPRIEDHIESLKGSAYFTSLDLASGYHQIPVHEESVNKTAFITPDGHYEYLRMPFGLANAPSVFQRMMNTALGDLRFKKALVYMDDVLVPSKSIEDGFVVLEEVLKRINEANLTLKLQKCFFFKRKIEYLGYEISLEGIQPGLRKIKAVSQFPKPCDVHQIRQFLGLASYFRKFVNNFAAIALPLTKLLKKESKFEWGEEQQNAFDELRARLSKRPVLSLYDIRSFIELHTDASKLGLGGILLQEQENKQLKPVAYYSRATTKEEQKYHSYELETLAVVCSLKQFRPYLIGKEFKVVTDCNALRSTLTKRDLIPRIGRWWLTIQEYNFHVEYRPGEKMAHVDALSRNPVELNENEVMTVDITTDDWVLAAQLRDENCSNIIDILSKKPKNEYEKKVHKEYTLKNNRLYRNTEKGKRWVVPKASRKEIVMCHHDNVGHFSLEKTLDYISKKYWFSSMRKYVKNYIDRCLSCIYNKVPAGKSPGYLNVIEKINVPMHTLHVDHLGPFVKSTRGNTHLLVVLDGFTKFVFMKPVPNTKVGPVIKMFDELTNLFGVPNRIVCDRGSCFTSEKFTGYCKNFGIKRILNATATPRANGQAERYNRTILSSIAASNEDERKWESVVSSIQWGLNITINKTTGKSPYEMLFGYVPRSANDSFLSNEVCENVHENVEDVRKEASSSINKQQELQKKNYDKRRCKPRMYKVGQYVVIRKSKGSNDGKSCKLLPKYSGPYVIKKVLPHDRYMVEDLPGSVRSKKKYAGISSGDKLKIYDEPYATEEEFYDRN